MIAELADGRELEFPDGTDPAVVQSTVKRVLGAGSATAPSKMGDTIAGLPITRLAMGAAAPVIAAGQLGANIGDKIVEATGGTPVVGKYINEKLAELEASKQRGMKAAGNEGYDVMGLLGNLLPAGKIAGAVKDALPAATTLAGRAGIGAAQGASIAAATPTTGGNEAPLTEKAIQTGIGGATGGVIPVASSVVQSTASKAKQLADPFLDLFRKEGPANFLRKHHEDILGKEKVKEVAEALLNTKQLVPGSKPTAAEALAGIPAGSPIQAAQRITASTEGGPSAAFGQRITEQQEARQKLLNDIAKKWTVESAEKTRGELSKPIYDQAMKEVVSVDSSFKDLLKRPVIQDAMKKAEELAKNEGHPFPASKEAVTVKKLHYMKLALDDMLKRPPTQALGKNEERTIVGAKQAFMDWVGNKSSTYDLARETFKEASVPVNRAQVREALKEKLFNPTGQETPTTFLKAADESAKMLKTATGNPRFQTIEDVLSPKEAVKARKVVADVARAYEATHPAQKTNLSQGVNVAREVAPALPSILSRPVVVANWLLGHVGKQNIEPKIDQLAAQMYLNPKELGKSLLPPSQIPSRTQAIIDALMQRAPMAGATAAARNY